MKITWRKDKKPKEKVVTIHEIKVYGIVTQYHVKVNGIHMVGGCVNSLEEAQKVFDRYLTQDPSMQDTIIKTETVVL